MKIKIKKLKELPDARHPNNIDEGFERVALMPKEFFKEPTVGESFFVGYSWVTSTVVEIIDEKTFKTLSSIYEWEILEE